MSSKDYIQSQRWRI